MYETLYRYLLKHKKLDLPGVGGISLQLKGAKANIVNHSFAPAEYKFDFTSTDEMPSERLFAWLALNLDITEQEAVIRFNDFVYDINRQLREGKQVIWQCVGSLHKEASGEIQFTPEVKNFPWHVEVVAEKITRRNAEHTMLVGEREKTSSQMLQLLNPLADDRTDHWWVWPLGVIIVMLIFLGWHFSANSNHAPTANQVKIHAQDGPSGYNMSP